MKRLFKFSASDKGKAPTGEGTSTGSLDVVRSTSGGVVNRDIDIFRKMTNGIFQEGGKKLKDLKIDGKKLKDVVSECIENLKSIQGDDKPHLIEIAKSALENVKDAINQKELKQEISIRLEGAKNVYHAINRVIEVYEKNSHGTIQVYGNEGMEQNLEKIKIDNSDYVNLKILGATTLGNDPIKPNEDAFFCDEEHQIFSVCDGVRSTTDSHLAAQLTSKRLSEEFSQLPNDIDEAIKEIPDKLLKLMEEIKLYAKATTKIVNDKIDKKIIEKLGANEDPEKIIYDLECELDKHRWKLVSEETDSKEKKLHSRLNKNNANEQLINKIKEGLPPLKSTMKTTASSVISKNGYAIIVNVGDSRVYLQEKGSQLIEQITHDASRDYNSEAKIFKSREWPGTYQKVAAYLPSFKGLSGDLQRYIRARGTLSQSLGFYDNILDHNEFKKTLCKIYVRKCSLGDKFLLITDGIHDNLTDDEIANIVSTPNEPAKALIEAAKKMSEQWSPDRAISKYQRPKPDDMTAIVIQVE